MLYLSSKDIEKLVDFEEVIAQIEKAVEVYEENNFIMPDRISILKDDDTYMYMPCLSEKVCGTKMLTLYPGNAQKQIDVIQGLMVLNDIETGKVKCILDGATITAYRTGGVGATGIKYTTRENVSSIGVIGAGKQAYYQILYATCIRNLKQINIFDLNDDNTKKLKEKLLEFNPEFNVNIMASSTALVEASDIIVTTTTSFKPVINEDVDLKNKHFIAIGSFKPNMKELPDSLTKQIEEVYIDVEFAKEESGDLAIPLEKGYIKEDQIFSLGQVLHGKKVKVEQTTLYKSVGMALFDIIIADYLYEKALKNNIGLQIED